MTAAQHYGEAERVRRAIRTPLDASQEGFDGWQRDDLIALAQVHATLALVAATAYPAIKDYCGDDASDSRQWTSAVSS